MTALWPGVDERRGRERLRTVLSRTRREAGPVVRRQGERIRLAEHVRVDVWEFDELADRALHRSGTRVAEHARAALSLHHRRVAPGLGDLHWVAAARERRRRRALALHDQLADMAEGAGRAREAAGSLVAALELDPTADHRALRASRLLVSERSPDAALELLQRTRTALADHDLDVSELDRAACDVRRRTPTI